MHSRDEQTEFLCVMHDDTGHFVYGLHFFLLSSSLDHTLSV